MLIEGVVGILASMATELTKHLLTLMQGREEQRRQFRRSTLHSLARHLTDAKIAAVLAWLALEKAGFPERFQNDNIARFEVNALEARHHAFFVAQELEDLVEEALTQAAQSIIA